MGSVLKAAAFKPEVTILADGENDIEEDDNWEVLNVGDQVGKSFLLNIIGRKKKMTDLVFERHLELKRRDLKKKRVLVRCSFVMPRN